METLGYCAVCCDDCRNDDAALVKLVEQIEPIRSSKIYIDDDAAISLGIYLAQKCRGGRIGTGHNSFAL
jgi:hypothetical protein